MAAENFGKDAYIFWQRIWAERQPQGFLSFIFIFYFYFFMAVPTSRYINLLESSGRLVFKEHKCIAIIKYHEELEVIKISENYEKGSSRPLLTVW
jgi:hypothetical protein